MRKWLQNNWFKLGLIVVALIAILIYFFSWLPIQEKKESLTNNIQCQQEGMKLSDKIEEELPEGRTYLEPQFRFVRELNTCLFTGSWISKSAQYDFIKDVYTNDMLGSYLIINGKEDSLVGDKEKYENLYYKYFPE